MTKVKGHFRADYSNPKWGKLIDDSDEAGYGEPNTTRIIRATKWSHGWLVETGHEKLHRRLNIREYGDLETYSNTNTKKDAKEMMKEYIESEGGRI